MNSTATECAGALRAAADFIEAHPDLPPVYVTQFTSSPRVYMNYYLHINDRGDEAEQRKIAAAIIRAVGGKWDKEPRYDTFRFTAIRGPLRFEIQVTREAVCKRVVVGTETVAIPAIEAQPERTEEREVIEWRCEPLLADEEVSA